MTTISELLQGAAKQQGISIDLLSQLLNIERIYLYLTEANPSTVIDRVRDAIKEAAK
jgi:hypothetical protein